MYQNIIDGFIIAKFGQYSILQQTFMWVAMLFDINTHGVSFDIRWNILQT